jgi:TetR/AcrR family transcriptional repressor of nem operon
VASGSRTGEFRSTADAAAVARRVQSTYYGLRILARVQDDRQALLDTVESTLAGL